MQGVQTAPPPQFSTRQLGGKMLQHTRFPRTHGVQMEAEIPASVIAARLTVLRTGSANVGIIMTYLLVTLWPLIGPSGLMVVVSSSMNPGGRPR